MIRRYASRMALVLLVPVGAVHAADDHFWYVGGGPALGNVFAVESYGLSESSERGSSDLGFMLTAGYRWNRYLSLETGYLDGGAPKFDGIEAYPDATSLLYEAQIRQDTSAFLGSVVGILPFGDRWQVYVRAGVAFWDAESEQRLSPLSGADTIERRISDNGTDFMMAVGGGMDITPGWHLRLDYQAFRTGDELLALSRGREARFDAFSIQLFRRFGAR
jgi:opacity protein-like surface antigen